MADSGVARILVRGEHFSGSAAWAEPPPPDAGEFSKIFEKPFMKMAKNALF